MAEPQPAALTTIVSQPSKAEIVSRASWRASIPVCSCSAPQQRGLAGAHTSKPSAASTPTVTALTLPKKTRCTQP
jgi:hypothetical protein